MNILIPLAGTANKFKEAGYSFPKALVEVVGKPLVQWTIENFVPLNGRYIFIVNSSDATGYNIDYTLKMLVENNVIIKQHDFAQGAACSALLAVDHIDNEEELIVAAGDQYIKKDICKIIDHFRDSNADGGIITFNSVHPQYSYAIVDKDGWISEVAEKKPISNNATVGIYWYRKGRDFIDAVKMMIKKEDMTNGQFYICPAFNQMLLMNKAIINYTIEKESFISFGTPEKVRLYNSKGKLG